MDTGTNISNLLAALNSNQQWNSQCVAGVVGSNVPQYNFRSECRGGGVRENNSPLAMFTSFFLFTSRDVVINDVALSSLKTPEWSQLVFCDVFVTILVWSLWWRHICSSVRNWFFFIDVSPICDEFCVVMNLNSFYDEFFWS
jgi:hypothetical protein